MNRKIQRNSRMKIIRVFLLLFLGFQLSAFSSVPFAQEGDLEFTLDVDSNTIPLPKIFKPNIDLSGRGFHRQASWPQTTAAPEAIDIWQNEFGAAGLYRLQYNLWEINEFNKDKELQNKLLENYENIIQKISDAGGTVILNIFGTPAGLGKVLDKKSPPSNLKRFKELVKSHIKRLSCDKRYNIWYEVWSAPDLDGFFLGRRQEYLNIYRVIAESVKELSAETKTHIPVGGPAVSWWFQNVDSNSALSPEGSLIYDLIKFCAHYHLPLDFITWHAYSSDSKAEKETTIYNKYPAALIRDWLSYFNFDINTPLIVDEWNYDNGSNILSARAERFFIAASYIPSRIKNMYEAGIDYQLYFCLEDFQNNKDNLIRNVGVFGFSPDVSGYKGGPKPIFNIFRMLANLGKSLFSPNPKLNDEFVGLIASTTKDENVAIIIYNYIDPEIVRGYLSRNISSLKGGERKHLLNIIKSDKLDKIINQELDPLKLRLPNKVKTILKKAQELNAKAVQCKSGTRNIKIEMKNLKGDYLYQRYTLDSTSAAESTFVPAEEKEVNTTQLFQEALTLNPYSVNLIILKKLPPKPELEAEAKPAEDSKESIEQAQEANTESSTSK